MGEGGGQKGAGLDQWPYLYYDIGNIDSHIVKMFYYDLIWSKGSETLRDIWASYIQRC